MIVGLILTIVGVIVFLAPAFEGAAGDEGLGAGLFGMLLFGVGIVLVIRSFFKGMGVEKKKGLSDYNVTRLNQSTGVDEKNQPPDFKPIQTNQAAVPKVTFYTSERATVTNTSFTSGVYSFPIEELYSAGIYRFAFPGILLIAAGLVAIGIQIGSPGEESSLLGLAILGAGIYVAVTSKYKLRITTWDTRIDALESKDKKYLEIIAAAINEAIKARQQ